MYFAQMYCYGKDPMIAGITGFQSCIGMIYTNRLNTYAVHIPYTANRLDGAARFANYIRADHGDVGTAGWLDVFTNGNQRGEALDLEAKLLKQNLGHPRTTVHYLENVTTAVVYASRKKPNKADMRLYVNDDANVTWVNGGGARAGIYDARRLGDYTSSLMPSNLTGFAKISRSNSRAVRVK